MIIERKEYLDKLISWKDKRIIKIVTGVRRCGKSMLLKIYQNYLKNQVKTVQTRVCIVGNRIVICILFFDV